jgi:hypothetical protein
MFWVTGTHPRLSEAIANHARPDLPRLSTPYYCVVAPTSREPQAQFFAARRARSPLLAFSNRLWLACDLICRAQHSTLNARGSCG